MSTQLAIVEDDPDIRAILQRSLSASGYGVTALETGVGLETVLSAHPHDLVIMDLGLPDIDGLTLTRKIRELFDVGIIILSGRGDLTDRVVGLELGADDYVTKPFEPREIVARVRSVLRRNGRGTDRMERAGASVPQLSIRRLEPRAQFKNSVRPSGKSRAAHQRRVQVARSVVTNANRVLSRDRLLDLVYENDTPAFDRSVDIRIGRVRKKLGDNPRNPRLIKTVRNDGYIFVGNVRASR